MFTTSLPAFKVMQGWLRSIIALIIGANMQVTFMTRLIIAMIDELKKKGFEITHTDVSEDEIEVLTFQNDNSDYSVNIALGKDDQSEWLEWSGSVRKQSDWWWDTGFPIEPLLEELGSCDDGINIRCAEDGDFVVTLSKYFAGTLSMENVDKNATKAIALDIIGSILNS